MKSGARAFICKDHLYKQEIFENEVLPTIRNVLKAA
jgi:hypothetical protein